MGHILEKIKKKNFTFLYGRILQGYGMGHILDNIKKIFFYFSV
jgi:hypothetical protein